MDATLRLDCGATSAIHIAICSYKYMHIIFNNKKKSQFVIIFFTIKRTKYFIPNQQQTQKRHLYSKCPVGENSNGAFVYTYINISANRLQQQGTENQVNNTTQNHCQRSYLAADSICNGPHQRRNHGAAKNPGNHQA